MADAKKCDVCDKFYMHEKVYLDEQNFDRIKLIDSRENGCYFDLCEDCRNALKEFLHFKK